MGRASTDKFVLRSMKTFKVVAALIFTLMNAQITYFDNLSTAVYSNTWAYEKRSQKLGVF